MRTVLTNQEVAEAWAAQDRPEARNQSGSLYFVGRTIYSYGNHFPIAAFTPSPTGNRLAVLFSHRSYSVTTSAHQRRAWSAWYRCPHRGACEKFRVFSPDWSPSDNLDDYTGRIKNTADRARRARSRRPWLIEQGRKLVAERRRFCEFFGLDCPADVPVILDNAEHFINGGPIKRPQEVGA